MDDIYLEETSELAAAITRQMIQGILSRFDVPKGARVVAVGCGSGLALEVFREHGCN